MKGTESGLLHAISFGRYLIQEYRERWQEPEAYTAVVSLIHIEAVLDSGRILLEPESDKRIEINKGLDEIRDGIVLLIEKMDKAQLETVLFSAGEQFKKAFLSNK